MCNGTNCGFENFLGNCRLNSRVCPFENDDREESEVLEELYNDEDNYADQSIKEDKEDRE